ncbi:30S ribosomal protein S16 [Patescibacteria group bacterium]|nr:30S ribosomal protein S16 [Patescibacteria group bacterium]
MLKVRLQRVGRKNDPSFRVVVTDSRRGPKSGNYIENLGSYSPRAKSLSLNSDRIKHWIAMGAQVSDTVHNLLVKEKVIDGKSINVLPKKSPVVKKDKEDKEGVGIEAKDTPAHTSQAVQGSLGTESSGRTSEEPSGHSDSEDSSDSMSSRRDDSKESDESSTEAEETPEETPVADDAPKEEKPEEGDQQKADESQAQATNAEKSTKEEVKAEDVKEEEESSDDSKEDTATSEEKKG